MQRWDEEMPLEVPVRQPMVLPPVRRGWVEDYSGAVGEIDGMAMQRFWAAVWAQVCAHDSPLPYGQCARAGVGKGSSPQVPRGGVSHVDLVSGLLNDGRHCSDEEQPVSSICLSVGQIVAATRKGVQRTARDAQQAWCP